MALLEVENIKKSFHKTPVLHGVDFSLEKGEVLAIIGASGSGKTTLLRCLNFLEVPEKGVIKVNGQVLFDAADGKTHSDKTIRSNRLHFGLVFQQFNLFPQYTVLKNVTLAAQLLHDDMLRQKRKQIDRFAFAEYKKSVMGSIERDVRQLLDKVGLSDKVNAYPCQLSGGQQQRVAIARALALKPDILCFDEPTSALDPELTGEVLRVIKALKSKDRTMIVVTHEMEFARNIADKVIFMVDGRIEEEGTPEQVFGSPRSEKTRAFLVNSKESYD